MIYLVFLLKKNHISCAKKYIELYYLEPLGKKNILLFTILAYTAFLGINSLILSLSGVPRHELLINEQAAGIDYLLLSGFFKVMFSISWFFSKALFLKIISMFGLLFVIMITASRSELAFVIFYMITLLMIAFNMQSFKKIIFIPVILTLTAILATVFLQNRAELNIDIFSTMLETVMKYRVYPYYLSEESMAVSGQFEKYLYPFFGYFSEYPMQKMFSLDNPVNTEFVIKFHVIGESLNSGLPYLANVLYPWWSWFVGSYGVLGLVLKAVYSFLILFFLISKRLYLTSIYFFMVLLFGESGTHPFMLVSNIFTIIMFMIFDLYAKNNYRRFYKA
ncbi:MAG: hypothetical protein IE909_11260 [Campylobacterales bacterium]|nr:hypothetical protein [Campylobacterales bacterium]